MNFNRTLFYLRIVHILNLYKHTLLLLILILSGIAIKLRSTNYNVKQKTSTKHKYKEMVANYSLVIINTILIVEDCTCLDGSNHNCDAALHRGILQQ